MQCQLLSFLEHSSSPLFYSISLYKPLIAQISSLLCCWVLVVGLILVMLSALFTPEPRCGIQRNSSEGSQLYFYSLFAFRDSAGAGWDGSVHTAQPTSRYFCARGMCGLRQSSADVWHSTALCSWLCRGNPTAPVGTGYVLTALCCINACGRALRWVSSQGRQGLEVLMHPVPGAVSPNTAGIGNTVVFLVNIRVIPYDKQL